MLDGVDEDGRPIRGKLVEEIWAYVAIDESDGCEGVVAMPMKWGGNTVPVALVGADRARMESMRPAAERAAQLRGRPVRLIRATAFAEIEVIEP